MMVTKPDLGFDLFVIEIGELFNISWSARSTRQLRSS